MDVADLPTLIAEVNHARAFGTTNRLPSPARAGHVQGQTSPSCDPDLDLRKDPEAVARRYDRSEQTSAAGGGPHLADIQLPKLVRFLARARP